MRRSRCGVTVGHDRHVMSGEEVVRATDVDVPQVMDAERAANAEARKRLLAEPEE